MKETGEFFSGLVGDLAALREATVQDVNILLDQRDQLEEKIRKAQESNQQVTSGCFATIGPTNRNRFGQSPVENLNHLAFKFEFRFPSLKPCNHRW